MPVQQLDRAQPARPAMLALGLWRIPGTETVCLWKRPQTWDRDGLTGAALRRFGPSTSVICEFPDMLAREVMVNSRDDGI
jgi:hypothetical protein